MRIELPTLQGRFLRRYKRFFADVELDDGRVITAHCPNTGSMLGCLEEGRRAVLRDSLNLERKLRYVLQALQVGRTWVNVDTGLPNAVVPAEIARGRLPELAGYDNVRREVKYGANSRIDVLLERADGARCYVEIKNTTLARGRVAQFPDAVTERGLKHLEELSKLARLPGHRAVQFFFVSRADVDAFSPAEDIDPAYAAGLRRAAAAGVEILAYRARVRPESLTLERRLEVRLGTPPRP
ncbi:MAG: DNA/RNA nuclease SfsA [Planctomycetes bacterium]|nr:DNA/RNA nuclease SfsA [Planctomycetota bacterium]